MLRLMKTFIFAAILVEQEPTSADNFLVLRRHASNVSDSAKEAKEAKKKEEEEQAAVAEREAAKSNRRDLEEAQFTSAAVRSSVGGETMPWPGANVGSGAAVYGPKPPPHLAAQNQVPIGVDGASGYMDESAMKAAEDKPSGSSPAATKADKDSTADSGEFESTPRFKQIVEQIRASNLSTTFIESINFVEMQEKLLDILAMFL